MADRLRKGETYTASPGDFAQLLKLFDADPSEAAEKYEVMRFKLRTFFRWRGAEDPDSLVDETLDRVLHRVAEGAIIHAPSSYIYSVARHLLREEFEKSARMRHALENDPGTRTQYDPEEERAAQEEAAATARRSACLADCLAKLPPEDRRMVLEYYTQGSAGKSAARKSQAESLGIPLNALRIRVFRLRAKLSECLSKCMGDPPRVK